MAERNRVPATVSEYQPNNPQNKKEKKGNFAARLCALLLAIVLWFYVMRVDSPTYERTFDYIPIELTGTEEMLTESGFSVISGYDGVVSVTLSGKQSDINRLKTAEISASVDLSSVTMSGDHHLPVSVTTKNGIKVIGYEPTTVEVYVDTTLQKDVEVKPRITYTKEESLVLGEYVTDPALIKVSGPATIVKSIDYAVTEVDLGMITKSMSATGSIKLCDESGNTVTNPYLKTNVSSVGIQIPVYKQKYLTPVVRFTDDIIPEQYIDVTLSRNVVSVQGEAEYIDALGDELIVASVDPRQIKDKYNIEVLLESVDSELDYLDGDTISIDITLDPTVRNIKRIVPVYLSEANIIVTGTGGDARYTVNAPEIMYIEARSVNMMALDALTADGITLRADLSTVSASGDYKREVVVEFNDPQIYTAEKYTVTFGVEIK